MVILFASTLRLERVVFSVNHFTVGTIWWIPSFLQKTITFQLTFTCSKSTIKKTRKRCEICSKLTIKTSEPRQWRRSALFVSFQHISHLPLVFLLLTLNKQIVAGSLHVLNSATIISHLETVKEVFLAFSGGLENGTLSWNVMD